MKVMFRAPLDRASGYGNDGVDLALGLDAAGFDVVPYPTSCGPGLPRRVTRLLEKPLGQSCDVTLMFAPPFDLRPSQFTPGVRAVGFSMWERTPILTHDFKGRKWSHESKRRLHPAGRFAHLDALAVTCEMNVAAFKPHTGDTPISVVPCGVDGDRYPYMERDRRRPLRFLMVGALGPRKNPFATLEAWRIVNRDHPDFDAELLLHSTVPGIHPGVVDAYGPGITVHTRVLPPEGLLDMYGSADVMLCPSRGEGNNKPPMEFMATGGHVLASDWSGHQNWLEPYTLAQPIPGRVGPSPLGVGASDFEVDVDEYADMIYRVWRDQDRLDGIGETNARLIRKNCGWDKTILGLGPLLEGGTA